MTSAAGTPYFMAPEVLTGVSYDSKADMWSIGVILYELITLKKPFDAQTVPEVLKMIVDIEYTPLPFNYSSHLICTTSLLLSFPH